MNADIDPILDESKFDAKLAQLEKSRQWSPRVVSRLETLIRNGDDYALFRVNPVAYSKEKGMDEREAIDLFLYAAVNGIFQMNWNLLCPGCTSVVESFSSLRNMDCHYHCEICNLDFEAALDDYIQISFTVSPDVRRISFHDPDSLADLEGVMKYRFAREGITKKDGANWIEQVMPLVKFFSPLAPGEKAGFAGRISDGFVIINELLNHLGAGLKVGGQGGGDGGAVEVTIEPTYIEASRTTFSAGERAFEFHNKSPKKGLITVMNLPPDYQQSLAIGFSPFLSGKRLLTSQTFRDLFNYEVVKGSESLGVKNIAILFTDLKGSTSLYERVGDLKAFSLVRQHFDVLQKVVSKNSGAIVKTIGDA
ncbi:MAG: adenylate/guanylate cyclase domain-containing protein, partial [Nitrospinae bacterium]|nr:adenylate/guanylate cyclase domain-containing protein [Nitrospinota bacterium]